MSCMLMHRFPLPGPFQPAMRMGTAGVNNWIYSFMRQFILPVFLVLSIPLAAQAEVECTDRPECWPEGSAMHTGLLLARQLEQAEALLARQHDALLKLVTVSAHGDSRLLNALGAQQAAWLNYRGEECELIGALTGAGGSWPSTYALRCKLNHTEQRLRRVRSAFRCVSNMPPEQRVWDQNRCLQQLAPLTNK